MKVRMLQSIAGTVDGARYPGIGGEFEVADCAALSLIEKGQAEAVGSPPKPERASVKKAEKRG